MQAEVKKTLIINVIWEARLACSFLCWNALRRNSSESKQALLFSTPCWCRQTSTSLTDKFTQLSYFFVLVFFPEVNSIPSCSLPRVERAPLTGSSPWVRFQLLTSSEWGRLLTVTRSLRPAVELEENGGFFLLFWPKTWTGWRIWQSGNSRSTSMDPYLSRREKETL